MQLAPPGFGSVASEAATELRDAPEGDADDMDGDDEIAEMQRKVREMEAEADSLKEFSESVDGADASKHQQKDINQEEVDKRSVYVGNVDYGSTPDELQEHFKFCGGASRITIMVDRISGLPKGFAYIEFNDEQSFQNSLLLNGSLFRGRQLKVAQKRTNIPGFTPNGKGKSFGKGKGKSKYGWWDPYENWGWDYGQAPGITSHNANKGLGKSAPY
eukprot:TRINITY_DN75945_c0_g1_i1.p1 TRINITY_DN75945_c0_g1~~TRINITY_DN75945_c0_g1_i1.p1  ORF type:complete len:216 (-),score=42.91 TRINITY_DN75945_c0_g1_i1:38-685(-)